MDREQLIQDHLHVVEIYARKFRKTAEKFSIDKEDLIGLGNIGLVKAANRYDDRENATFQTFASRYVEGTIRNGIRDWGAGLTYTRAVKELSWKIGKIDEWEKKTLKEVSELTGARYKDVLDAVSLLTGNVVSIDASQDEDEDGLHSFAGRMDDYSMVIVKDFTENLSEQELKALQLSSEGYFQQEIGERLGVSQVHAGRLLKKNVQSKWKEYAAQ